MRAPRFWFTPQNAPGFWPRVLMPFTFVWRFGAARKAAKGKNARVGIPIICVGNINVGGTGKTPTVIEVIDIIQSLGKIPHVITRGYGGSLAGPVEVLEQHHSANDVGDEPLLLAAFARTWVAKDRLAGARAAEAAGADVLILDDGMQNFDIIKDFTVLVVDAGVGFGNGRLLPAGPLRQSISDGLAIADMVLPIGPGQAQHQFKTEWPNLGRPVVKAHLKPLETGMDWTGLRAFAFAGIGRPEKFYDTLQSLGANVVRSQNFGDHQKIPLQLLQRMELEAANLGAQLVTTEKDAVRLPPKFRTKVLTLPVRLELDDPEPLTEAISEILTQRTQG